MLAAVLVEQAAGNAGLRQSRLTLDDRPQGAAGPAGVVAERSGDAGGSGQPQDGDDQVACSLNYGDNVAVQEAAQPRRQTAIMSGKSSSTGP